MAYTQGTNIHVAPGQEKHLPHEAWHVVQQAQGRVKPTMQLKGIQMNDDVGLEREADEMVDKIDRLNSETFKNSQLDIISKANSIDVGNTTVQRTKEDAAILCQILSINNDYNSVFAYILDATNPFQKRKTLLTSWNRNNIINPISFTFPEEQRQQGATPATTTQQPLQQPAFVPPPQAFLPQPPILTQPQQQLQQGATTTTTQQSAGVLSSSSTGTSTPPSTSTTSSNSSCSTTTSTSSTNTNSSTNANCSTNATIFTKYRIWTTSRIVTSGSIRSTISMA